jgi:PleD family two-component response regulator
VLRRLQEVTPPQGAFSAGVATWNAPDEQLGALLRRADLALYAAKTKGGARTEIAPQDSLLQDPALALDR